MSLKKTSFEDDGRTIADMSGVSKPHLFGARPSFLSKKEASGGWSPGEEKLNKLSEERRQTENTELSPEERRIYLFGALKASLLIAFAYIGGLGLLVWLLLCLWGA